MSGLIDMTGGRFGRLTVLSRAETSQGKKARWVCQCDCGNTKTIDGYKLRTGHTQSCGCFHSEISAKMLTIHGQSATPAHVSWRSMIQRCIDPNSTSYPRYGGRGITVCDRWLESFENFLSDMGERPEGCSLDRVDPDKNYEPSNCRWSTNEEQANNKRNNQLIEIDGQQITIAEASRLTGIPGHILYRRKSKGLSDFEIISNPVLRHKRNR